MPVPIAKCKISREKNGKGVYPIGREWPYARPQLPAIPPAAYNCGTNLSIHLRPFPEKKPMSDITLTQAKAAIEAAIGKANELGVKMNIAIVDAGTNLKGFVRMDGAWLGSIDISMRKARTAKFFDMPTGEIGKLSQPGGSLYNIEISNGGLITFPGGVSPTCVSCVVPMPSWP